MKSTISTGAGPAAPPPRILPRRARLTILTAHVMMSVGLLGDSAGFLAVAVRAHGSAGREAMLPLVETLKMFSLVFGIPLSFGALITGLVLGLGSKWGVFRYPWVTAKLLLVVSVMAVGGLVIGPTTDALLSGDGLQPGGAATLRLIAAAAYDVAALAIATTLSVFKPGGPFARRDVTAIR
jgi:hypothetical protein